jgi:hypothetical protein
MGRTRLVIAGLFACAAAGVTPFQATAGANMAANDKDIKLSGCLVKGEGDGSGYLLTNLPSEPAWQSTADANVVPSAVGTSGGFATIFYWLDGDSEMKRHIGHRVEIEGDLKGDLKDGEIKADRKDKWTELTVKSDGRSMKANVPNASLFPASDKDKDRKVNALVRKVDVKKVRMLDARCE